MPSDCTIEVEHLSKIYGTKTAIEDVHFTVRTGEINGFLGPNGAGKTTTMRILAGYLPATTGTARIAGYDVHREPLAVRRHIGYLPENPPLYPDMSVIGYLHFVAKIKGVKERRKRQKQVETVLERCQIADKSKTIIRQLSKGYRQRVGIAGAIVHEPPVIILDEPTVGLDPRQIIEVRNLIKSLAGEHTIVLSTHILPEANAICDRVTIIKEGKVVTTNTPDELLKQLNSNLGYELEVEGEIAPILPSMQNHPGVAEVKIAHSPHRSERKIIEIVCQPNCEPGKDLAIKIIETGLCLHEMRRIRPSLEDVFLQLTTEEST